MNHFKPVLTPLCLFDAVVVVAALTSACIAETSAAQVSIMPWLSSACPPTRSTGLQGCETSWVSCWSYPRVDPSGNL